MLQDYPRTSTYQKAFLQNKPDFLGKVCLGWMYECTVLYVLCRWLETFHSMCRMCGHAQIILTYQTHGSDVYLGMSLIENGSSYLMY